jgi:hypothetical protein
MRLLYKLLWNGTTELNFDSINVSKKDKIKGNTMSITFSNKTEVISNNEIIFDKDQTIQLFAKYDYTGGSLDTSSTSNDLIFNGSIKTFKLDEDSNKWRLKLECIDKSYNLLNKLWGKNYTDTVPNIIKNIIDMGGFTGDDLLIDATIDSGYPYTSGIQGKRPNNTSFPKIRFGLGNKPLFEWLETLSQTDYTNSMSEINDNTRVCKKPFKFHIDTQNKFQWFYPTDTPKHYLEYGKTDIISPDTRRHRIISDSLEKGTFNEINFVIYKAGEDMDNIQILDFELDPTAKSLTTADSFRNWEDIARNMKQEDIGNITKISSDEYDYPSSYPVTPEWDSQEREVSSDSDYNDNFREEAIIRGDARARREFSSTGDWRWKGKIILYGEVFEPTDLINYTKTNYGLTNLKMRIKQVDYTIDKSSFITTLSVEEDEEELQ